MEVRGYKAESNNNEKMVYAKPRICSRKWNMYNQESIQENGVSTTQNLSKKMRCTKFFMISKYKRIT